MNGILNKELLYKFAKIWVGFGAISGGFISGTKKLTEVFEEEPVEYINPIIEAPISMVYNTSRIAGMSGFGAFIGGSVALTAPVSMPLYIYWRSINDHGEK